jgi:hypothetical protein
MFEFFKNLPLEALLPLKLPIPRGEFEFDEYTIGSPSKK